MKTITSPLRALVVATAACWLAGCAQNATVAESTYSASHPAPNDNLIIPGQRIGPIYLGMTAKDIYRTMGTPTASYPSAELYFFGPLNGEHTRVQLDDGVVTQIATTNKRFHTTQNLTIGTPELAIRAMMGNPECVVPVHRATEDVYGSVGFDVHGGVVTAIGVPNKCP